jgi:ubiquinone biosynthesis monooxygenase Coq7
VQLTRPWGKLLHNSFIDRLIINLDVSLRAITGSITSSSRDNPAKEIKSEIQDLSLEERQHVIGLMRVDHSGEVCAQALYQGQAWIARSKEVQEKLRQSAVEENDHLAWTQERIHELGGEVSYLNPLWYVGSFAVGVTAGILGDKWNLGFLAETEKQVAKHLDNHINALPENDLRSRKILEQMREDELHHATVAIENGGVALPHIVKTTMTLMSKVMTTLAYRV